MNADRPRFTVIIPARNEEMYLDACLRSLAAQDFTGQVEVIVVDNNSTDDTAAIARSHGVRLVSETQPGVCWARQRGLRDATGAIVVSTDADTTFATGWLRTIDEHLQDNPEAVAVAGTCVYVDGPWWSGLWERILFGTVRRLADRCGNVIYVTATNLAFRRDAFAGYDTQMSQGGDELDVLRRLRAVGRVLFVADNPTYTSARRLHRGLLYSLFVSLGYHYLFSYVVNRFAGRQVLGTAPAANGRNLGRRSAKRHPARGS